MRGKYKPQRGRARRFTSSHDPEAYIRSRPVKSKDDGEEEASETEEIESTVASESTSETSTSTTDSEEEGFEDSPNKVASELGKVTLKEHEGKPAASDDKTRAPRELSRREREAIEKEKARQHYLKMKEKEDAARLAIIKKKREEEAARHAADQKAKEEARFNRR